VRVLGNTLTQNKRKRNSGLRHSQSSLISFLTRLRAGSLVGPRRQQRLGLQIGSKRHEAGLAARGFTIVELLIVVVVIAILAAITVVSYNGISSQARESTLKSELSTAAQQLQIAKLDTGSYPGSLDDIKISDAFSFTYTAEGGTFCLSGTHDSMGGKSLKVTEAGSIVEGSCAGVEEPEDPTPPFATTMQAFTPAMCANLDTYNGTNEDAVITLTDTRADQQEYQIAKLADNNCWMLSNLRLGSTTGTTTLTPSDSDVAGNFTLPQVTIPSVTDYDNPQVIGPVPSDSTTDPTKNYGYLYNWSAATAGESRTSHTEADGDAQYSICPAGWKLPTGGTTTGASDFSRLDQAFGGTGAYQSGTPAHLATGWLNTGAFKGVFSGYWYGSFDYQGSHGDLWSRSASPSSANNAFSAGFYSSGVSPGTGYYLRFDGLGVRCLLN